MVETDDLWDELLRWAAKSQQLFVKKLARNDCSWADDPGKHQNGFYVPSEIRESGFFPELKNVNPEKSHIFESSLPTVWPATGEVKRSNLKHYSNKGSEMHCTGVPKEAFADLTPASLLVGGVLKEPLSGYIWHWFFTVDSGSDLAARIETSLDVGVSFLSGLFEPSILEGEGADELARLVAEIEEAMRSDTLADFIAAAGLMPTPEALAIQAQSRYMTKSGARSLDPFAIDSPGDALMEISRDIEFSLYKTAEMRFRAAEVIKIVSSGDDVVSTVVRNFGRLDALFLSASQQRKSRAGRSFENHIAKMLGDGRIAFEEQVVTGGRRPDFVLPDLATLNNHERGSDDVLILSAKTTLRERWKQLALEKFRCGLFLATVDDRVSASAIDDMSTQGIHLVVPESLKKAKEACYAKKSNVISFREFFDDELAQKRAHLIYPLA
ncbi:MAG: EcoRII [Proteobacteria bacterium]|nr:MAG: EcoRII [Pseudomonadota bacterium]